MGPRGSVGDFEEEALAPTGIQTQDPPARNQVATPFRLLQYRSLYRIMELCVCVCARACKRNSIPVTHADGCMDSVYSNQWRFRARIGIGSLGKCIVCIS